MTYIETALRSCFDLELNSPALLNSLTIWVKDSYTILRTEDPTLPVKSDEIDTDRGPCVYTFHSIDSILIVSHVHNIFEIIERPEFNRKYKFRASILSNLLDKLKAANPIYRSFFLYSIKDELFTDIQKYDDKWIDIKEFPNTLTRIQDLVRDTIDWKPQTTPIEEIRTIYSLIPLPTTARIIDLRFKVYHEIAQLLKINPSGMKCYLNRILRGKPLTDALFHKAQSLLPYANPDSNTESNSQTTPQLRGRSRERSTNQERTRGRAPSRKRYPSPDCL